MSTMSSFFVSTITLAILAFNCINCVPVDADSGSALELKMSNGQFFANADEQFDSSKPHLLAVKAPLTKRDHMIEGILLGKRDYLTEGILLGKRDYPMEGILLGKREYPTQGFLLGKRNMRFFAPKASAAGHHAFDN